MAETKPGTSPVRARIGNTGEEGRRQPAPCLSHLPRGEELPINHLGQGNARSTAQDGSAQTAASSTIVAAAAAMSWTLAHSRTE